MRTLHLCSLTVKKKKKKFKKKKKKKKKAIENHGELTGTFIMIRKIVPLWDRG